MAGGLCMQFAPALGRVGDRGRFASVWLDLSWRVLVVAMR